MEKEEKPIFRAPPSFAVLGCKKMRKEKKKKRGEEERRIARLRKEEKMVVFQIKTFLPGKSDFSFACKINYYDIFVWEVHVRF